MNALTNEGKLFYDDESNLSDSSTVAVGGAVPKRRWCVLTPSPEKLFIFEIITIPSNWTVKGIELEAEPEIDKSITLSNSMGINSNFIDILESFRILDHNWDSYGGDAPMREVLDRAISFVKGLQLLNEVVYQVAPGPNGEIMIELRNGGKSIEFLFYPTKTKYVDFTNENAPKQGAYAAELLTNLLRALHG